MHIYDTLQDLIELTTPPCVIGINTACTYEDEEGARRRVCLRCYLDVV